MRDDSQRMYALLTYPPLNLLSKHGRPLTVRPHRSHQARKRSARRGQERDWGLSGAEGGGVQGFWGRGTATKTTSSGNIEKGSLKGYWQMGSIHVATSRLRRRPTVRLRPRSLPLRRQAKRTRTRWLSSCWRRCILLRRFQRH